jgi:predicted ArsR family transcriptional regulator
LSTPADAWTCLEVLAEPTRRRVFETVRAATGPSTREAVADGVGITARLAAFHLDRLAEAGLVRVDYARPPGRSGPGAGRPAKRYAPAPLDVEVSLPPRNYNLVAKILATAVATEPTSAYDGALRAARATGAAAGTQVRPKGARTGRARALAATTAALETLGYEPAQVGDTVRLRNCPFHDVVAIAPDLVCDMNEQLIDGVLEGLGVTARCQARLAPNPPDCCVTVQAR